MGLQYNHIPIKLPGLDYAAQFYCAQKRADPFGRMNMMVVSYNDPEADIRSWPSLSRAQVAANHLEMSGAKIDCIIRLDDAGWTAFEVAGEKDIGFNLDDAATVASLMEIPSQSFNIEFGSW